jgi:tetratricopeptide (TPR) repeat protein
MIGVWVFPALFAQPVRPEPVLDVGPVELLNSGEADFNHGRWREATTAFQKFLTNYGGLPDTAATVAKVKPLLAICQVRLGEYDAAITLLDESLSLPDLKPNQRTDLLFFAGMAKLKTGQAAAARQHLGAIFGDLKVERSRRMEALILGGMSYVVEKNWIEAISFFQKHNEEIRAHQADAGARADLLLLFALMEEKRWEDAEALARRMGRNSEGIRQWVQFSSLLIALGSHFLEAGESHRAIILLRQVLPKSEILRLQTDRLREAESEMKFAEQNEQIIRSAQLQATIDEIHRELETFENVPQFDSAARLRLASAYFQQNRVREGCLILDQMVRQMEPDETVESATASLIRGWMSLNRFIRAERTADLYLERFANFPQVPNLPEVMFLKAQALEGQVKYQDASNGYLEVCKKFEHHAIAPQARFMATYNILQQERYTEAEAAFSSQMKTLKPTDEIWPHVAFWHAMTYYFDQKWEECRRELEAYLAATKKRGIGSEYADNALFRTGYTYFSEARYPEAIRVLTGFVSEYPTSEWMAEALLTLGDCHAAEGDLKAADSAYQQIGEEAPGFHDEGWMKRGNLRKAQKDWAGMKSLFTDFLKKRPQSPRTVEALQGLGWVAKQEGDVNEARRIYWEAIWQWGNEPARPGLEDIFIALRGFYSGEDQNLLEETMHNALEKSRAGKTHLLSTRLGWALAQFHLSDRSRDESMEIRKQRSREELVRLAPEIEPKETAPRILADLGDALAETGDSEKAKEIYEGLRKWWPRAPERDRAFAGLGFIAMHAKDELKALECFDRYEKSSIMPKSAPDEHGISLIEGETGGKVALARAELLEVREPDRSLAIFLAMQKSKAMPARLRAEAFLKTGRHQIKQGHTRESLPYFEQVYLLFNRFPDLVAQAYFERGEALEKLGLTDKAREVYSELASRTDLVDLESFKRSVERANALGGVLQPKQPEGAVIPPQPAAR